jgi:AcrR family transcriptional regulator
MSKSNSTSGKVVGRRAGNADTKAQIVKTAQVLFAKQGLDQTTMRQIASKAEVDPALIVHYFKTKQQLFIESVAPIINAHRANTIGRAFDDAKRDEMGQKLAEAFVATMTNNTIRPLLLSLIRSMTSDGEAAKILRNFADKSVIHDIEKYTSAPDQKLKSELIFSQFIGVLVARHIIKIEPLASAEPATVSAYLAPRLQTYFD